MRNLHIVALGGVLLGAVFFGRPSAEGQGRSSSGDEQRNVQQWDYSVVTLFGNVVTVDGKDVADDFAVVLRRLGKDGWELATAVKGVSMETSVQYVFKRPRR